MNYSYVLLSEQDGRFYIQRRASWLADIDSNKLERH